MEYNTQIAIIGGGAAGMAAAVAAAELGATVLVVEANTTVGGNGLFPRGIFGVDSAFQRRQLIFADVDEIFTSCMEYSHWNIDGKLVKSLINKSGSTIDWLEGMGVEFNDVVHHIPNQSPEVFHITGTKKNTGKAVIDVLKEYGESLGVKILTNTKGKSLLLDEQGAVIGVLGENKNNEMVKVIADKVIVCTGGFAGNAEMISEYFPGLDAQSLTEGPGMRHKGDGIKMAVEIGADIEGNFAMEIAAPRIKGHEPLNLLIGKPQNIWVNKLGQRFANEGIVYNFSMAANACLRQPEKTEWVIFDSEIMKSNLSDGRDIIELIHIPLDAPEHLEDALLKAQNDGTMIISESLADIAQFIDCSLDTLQRTIEEYNQFCEQNRDMAFAKERRYLSPLNNPPYYAIKAGVSMIVTHGGIKINDCFEALNDKGEKIPNLYIAGVDFGGADAGTYNVALSGHGFGFAVNSGRLAGEYSATQLK